MKCFDCDWLDCVGNMFCQYCIENDYILYATKEDKELCDMMCGKVEIVIKKNCGGKKKKYIDIEGLK